MIWLILTKGQLGHGLESTNMSFELQYAPQKKYKDYQPYYSPAIRKNSAVLGLTIQG